MFGVVTCVGLAVITACTGGNANQGSTSTSSATPEPSAVTTPSTTSPSATVAIPARPKEVRLDGVDPCKLLTEAQQHELKIDEVRVGKPSNIGGSPCSYDVR